MRVPADGLGAVDPTTLLGNWYANLIHVQRQQLILCVSERTLLPVLVPARDAKSLAMRLPDVVAEMLRALAIPSSMIDRELQEMSAVVVDRTADRRVLGSMTDLAFMAACDLADGCAVFDTARRLAKAPCKPIDMESPDRATVALFADSLQ
jgi:Domain of unknown function (DUF6933)